jgi:hypothetical protein
MGRLGAMVGGCQRLQIWKQAKSEMQQADKGALVDLGKVCEAVVFEVYDASRIRTKISQAP